MICTQQRHFFFSYVAICYIYNMGKLFRTRDCGVQLMIISVALLTKHEIQCSRCSFGIIEWLWFFMLYTIVVLLWTLCKY